MNGDGGQGFEVGGVFSDAQAVARRFKHSHERIFGDLCGRSLIWLPEHGIGFYPVPDASKYDAEYFRRYEGYAKTDQGVALTEARLRFVNAYAPGASVLDVGCGSGQFVAMRRERLPDADTWGYEVNPLAIGWLQENGCWRDLAQPVETMTFWDSLEHIFDPEPVLALAASWVFVAMPIYRDATHVLHSKHYRPDEHFWYFTHDGLCAWMATQGFAHRETRGTETTLGREDILSFAFERVSRG